VVTRSVTLPESVKHFGTEAPTTFRIERLKVALHGQGFRERAVTDNLVMHYPSQVAGYFNIGVLHTALGRPEHDNYAPATAGHLRARGYDYWALGHIHEFEVLQKRPYIVFPGNLQGRHMREQGPKGAVLVTVTDNEVTDLERVIVDHARWLELEIDAAGETSEAALLKLIEEQVRPIGAEASERLVALRVTLKGETELHARLVTHREQLTDEVQAACQRVHGDIWLERLDIRTTAPRAPSRSRTNAPLASIDLAALLADLENGEELQDRAGKLIADLRARIPGTIPEREQDFAAELPQLIAEARDLLLTRASGEA
jgi:DNA repair exonuclease SbcCD nuclease subunit